MQIRIQARKIQCIRSVYAPEIKRSRQKVVASFPSCCRVLSDAPAEALAALNEAEQAQLRAWLDARHEVEALAYRKTSARLADRRLKELTVAIENGEVELSSDYAARIWRAMMDVDRALRKAGFPRIKRPRAKPGAAPKGKGGAA